MHAKRPALMFLSMVAHNDAIRADRNNKSNCVCGIAREINEDRCYAHSKFKFHTGIRTNVQ